MGSTCRSRRCRWAALAPLTASLTASLTALLAGCGGAAERALSPLPPRRTRAPLVGGLCERDACRCRELSRLGDSAGWDPTGPDRKRYELRLGPHDNELWVQVDGHVVYKGVERAEECFYLELRPGRHRVRVRAREEHGFGVRLAIAEMSGEGPWWYDTFELACGTRGGVCDRDTLAAEVERIRKYPRQLRDPCGSTKVEEVSWQAERLPDNLHAGDLQLDFTLHIYKFIPRYRPGSPECAGRSG